MCVFSPKENVYQGIKDNGLSAISDVSAALWASSHSQASSTKPDSLLVDSHVLPSQAPQCLTHLRLTLTVQRPQWQQGAHS